MLRTRMRAVAKRIALRLPFGVGRFFRGYVEARTQLWQMEQRDTVLYWRLVSALEGKTPEELGLGGAADFPEERPMSWRTLLSRLRTNGRFVELLLAGHPLEDAVAEFVVGRLDADDHLGGRSLAQALLGNATTREAGHLASALVGFRKGLPALAWASFQEVPAHTWRRLAPGAYLAIGLQFDRDTALASVRELVESAPADVPPHGWVDLARAAFGGGEERLAERILDLTDRLAAASPETWHELIPARSWLRGWIDKALRPAPPPGVPAGQVALAVLDYKQPDRRHTSSNLGDYVQTLASLGHVVRHQNLRFHGASDLVDLATELQKRVRPELALETAAREVTLVGTNRDASGLDPIPENCWLIAFGWFMHSMFGRFDFPLHPHLRPVFVSFHCNRPEILTPAAVDYLRRYGPIGCRDWTTVDILLSAGVPAFLTGCLTTTVNTLFPDLVPGEKPAADAPVAYVDVDAPLGTRAIRQERGEVRESGLVPNLRAAVELMETYRRRYSAIVTSRLHCYLPARSVGVKVDFQPKNPADFRFNGLADLTDADYAAMRDGLRGKLERVLTAIFAGGTEQHVYELWRELTAPEVELARTRHESVPPIPPPSFDLERACASVRSRQVHVERTAPDVAGPEVHVALALDGNLKNELKVVVEAMATHASRPLHLWILCREHGPDDYRQLAVLFPEITFTWLPCDDIDYGPVLGMLKHITVSTMDRLLLPDLLPELDRIIYHDIDALPLADLSELYEWELEGRRLAGRSAVATHATSALVNMMRSAKRLRENPSAAYDCVHRMCARHHYDFTAFNAGILVLNLARMRADGFCREFIPFVEQYGMNDQEVLNCYAGADRAVLTPEWNSFPTQEPVDRPKVIHWAGPLKPWKARYVLLREHWETYTQRLRARERGLGDPESLELEAHAVPAGHP